MDQRVTWQQHEERSLTAETLRALFDNEIPAIRIKGFATPAECADFAAAIRWGIAQDIMRYYSVKPRVGYIGTAQVEYRWGHKRDDYFIAVKQAWADWHKIIARTWNPLERFMQTLRDESGQDVRIADEPGRGDLFAGIIRLASNGVGRHVDYAPLNTPDYAIASVNGQLGWNLFVDAPGEGGVTTVHNRPWNVQPEAGKDPPMSYGLDDNHVAGAEAFTYAPVAGDVVLFNSRNPHEVSPGRAGDHDRLQIGSFVGRLPAGDMVLWS
ncbi:MAG: hypothetical protein O3C65_03565 [Proteobacteria bacterium]|nr:hypothetical protein [Pseudomonadota bacterium]MDA1057742.1 hypothetical protein [Pseudomonadota bacterium]